MAVAFAGVDTNGGSLETYGFVCLTEANPLGFGVPLINGYAITTFGLLCSCEEIWDNFENDGISTSWSNSEDSITTTWTQSTGGIFGDCVF